MSNYQRVKISPLGTVILCTIVPFYSIFWMRSVGKILYQRHIQAEDGGKDYSEIYFILAFLRLGLISLALIQGEINQINRDAVTVTS